MPPILDLNESLFFTKALLKLGLEDKCKFGYSKILAETMLSWVAEEQNLIFIEGEGFLFSEKYLHSFCKNFTTFSC